MMGHFLHLFHACEYDLTRVIVHRAGRALRVAAKCPGTEHRSMANEWLMATLPIWGAGLARAEIEPVELTEGVSGGDCGASFDPSNL